MKTKQRLFVGLMALILPPMVSGCSGMTAREQNTVAGAGIGGIAGAVLTHGSAVGTVGGAVVGGVIGHELGEDHRYR